MNKAVTEIDNNILLAEFVGGKLEKWEEKDELTGHIDTGVWYIYFDDSFGGLTPDELDYHSNWNSLMEIVDKIESIVDEEYGKFSVSIRGNTCCVESSHLWKVIQGIDTGAAAYMSDCNAILNTKIESTYYNVVEFVKWYNELVKLREESIIKN